MRKRILLGLIFLLALCQTAVHAQTSRITGRVIGQDNQPVVGASVTISGTSNGTVTDVDGNFAISAPRDASLLINSIGFADQTIRIDGRSSINVKLSTGQSAGLDEVVVTGYTSQRKKDIVGSVAVVDVKALKAVPSGSALQALQGQASGVNVSNTGSPGAQSSIFIRGINGNSSSPLVLIDGIQGEINDVPANDVESIQVLKDAGAASIYGSRGSNGVIIITTKRGRSGKTTINYNSYYNYQMPFSSSKANIMSATEYAKFYHDINPSSALFNADGTLKDFLYRQGITGARGAANTGDPLVDPAKYKLDISNPQNSYIISKVNKDNSGQNMWDAIFAPALMMNHSVTASGATDRSSYLFSMGYLDQQGTLINTFLKRYNARINTTFAIGKNVRIGENLNIQYKNNPQSSANGAFGPIQTAVNNLPILPIRDIAGNFSGDFAGPPQELGDWGNALADATLVQNNRRREWGMVGNAFIEADILKHFTARASLGGNVTNYYNQTYLPRAYWRRSGNNDDQLTEASGFNSLLQFTGTLNYKNSWGLHNVSALAGVETVETAGRYQNQIGTAFFINDYNYIFPNTAGVVQPLPTGSYPNGSYAIATSLYSKIGRVDYNYADKYLLGFTIRDDGYSAFGPEKKHGVFPALALGWRLSQESFMKNVYWVNDLKLRGSYGSLGNKDPATQTNQYSTYRQGTTFSYYNINGDGSTLSPGFFPSQYGNRRTTWEEDRLFNVGIDATLFKNKLDFSIEYYEKKVKGLLFPPRLPNTAGEGNPALVNLGDVQNKGIDFNVNYRAQLSKDVLFTVGVNFTHYKNKVVSLPDPGYTDVGMYRIQEGHPFSSFYGYKVIGLFSDSNQVKSAPLQDQAAAGRYRYLDVDGNDTINDKDRTHLGSSDPKFTMGVILGLNVKNFDFAAQIYTVQGGKVYNGNYDYTAAPAALGNKSRLLLDAWTPTHTNTRIRKNETATNFSTGTNIVTDQWLENGSYVKLRLVQLGYTFAPGLTNKIGVTRLRLYLQGTNLITITKYSGIDPEVVLPGSVQRGLDAGAYVPQKGVVFGLDLTF